MALDEGTPGGAALVLVGTLAAQLMAKGIVDGKELIGALHHAAFHPQSRAEKADAENALAMVIGMADRLPG